MTFALLVGYSCCCWWFGVVGSGGLLTLQAVESAGDSLLDLDSGM